MPGGHRSGVPELYVFSRLFNYFRTFSQISCIFIRQIISVMIGIDKELVAELLARAAESPRLRQNFDLRSCATGGGSEVVDNSQRMLNALMPGTVVPIHRHPNSNESIILISGSAVELFYDAEGREVSRCLLDREKGSFGVVVEAGDWHTIQALEPTVIFEVKDGRYGEDGSEEWK